MSKETIDGVEAVLLDSEGEPEKEVADAFRSVIWFAKNELGASDDQLLECFRSCLQDVGAFAEKRA